MGWDQAVGGGGVSKKWGDANMLYCTIHLNQGDMAIQAAWSAPLVRLLWQYGMDQWIAQNEYIYHMTKGSK